MEERLVRISDLERLKAYLAKQGGKATCAAIEQAFGWSSDKLADLVTASAGHVKRANLGRAAGVALIGSERGQRGSVPLYRDVRRVLETTWARAQGWQAAKALDTALNGKADTGVWSRPDCVLAWYPARRRSPGELPTLSSYEIEAPGRFDIRSVYEAHAHGFGADYSWVVFFRPDASSVVEVPHPDWARILAAAKTCGIGLLSVTNSGNATTWRIERPADRRTDGEREEFVRRALPMALRVQASLPLEAMRGR